MADRATIARPYARAAFAHAQASKDLASWSKLLGAAAQGVADPRVAPLIGNPHVTGEELVDLLGGLSAKAGGEANGVRMVGDVKLMARAVENIDIKDLKSLADEGKKQLGSGVVALVGVTGEGKAGIVVGVTNDLTARFNAVDLVRKGAEALGGKGGGGRPDMAQAGGPDGSRADAALAAIETALGG